MANNCQIPTPREYVLTMLDFYNSDELVLGKRILENSCGEGNILCEIVQRYIENSRKKNKSDIEIKHGLENDVVGYETDKAKIQECVERLSLIAHKLGISDVKWKIINEDYLRSRTEQYDVIVGNPPYITYHDMTKEQREQLSEGFVTCKSGRYDYCYAFIEKSIKELSETGKLVYLIPYSVLRNKFATCLRRQILNVLTKIYDYEGIKIFDDIISSSVIIVCEKGCVNSSIEYCHVQSKISREIQKCQLGEKWFFEQNEGERRFGDYFDVMNSVATLKNDVFVLLDSKNEEFEQQLIYPAVSAKSLRKGQKVEIIVPYILGYDKFERIEENHFKTNYPMVYKFLLSRKASLQKRDKSQENSWFEYGRTQALNKLLGKKLVLSMLVTNKVNVYLCDERDIPYAGYFIKQKEHSDLDLYDAKRILESDRFYAYAQTHGTPTTPTSYRLSVKEIKDYTF